MTGQPTRDADWGRKDESAVVDKGNRYGAELDSPGMVGGELTVSRRTIVGILAFILAVGVAFYVLLTTPILDAPTDQPTESPAATTGEIPTAVLFVHGRSARVVTR
jgi:hypothetical protein